MAKEKPPIFGMLQRGGEVVIRMLANVKQVTIGPIIGRTIAKGTLVYADEYDIYRRLAEWGFYHETVSLLGSLIGLLLTPPPQSIMRLHHLGCKGSVPGIAPEVRFPI